MSTTATTRQNFRLHSGPDDSCNMPDALFELTNFYVGEPTPTGRIPCIEVTYYVVKIGGEGCEYPEREDEDDQWVVDACWHHWCSLPNEDDPFQPDNSSDEGYDYDGGSDLIYRSYEGAVRVCRDNFAKYDEAWKLNDWTPA